MKKLYRSLMMRPVILLLPVPIFLLLCLFYYGGMLLCFPDYVGTYKSASIPSTRRPEELLLIISAGLYWSGLFNVCTSPAANYRTAS